MYTRSLKLGSRRLVNSLQFVLCAPRLLCAVEPIYVAEQNCGRTLQSGERSKSHCTQNLAHDSDTRLSTLVQSHLRASRRADQGCLAVTDMSTATASVVDVSRTALTTENDNRAQNNSGLLQGQCMPMPLPALGTQRIIQGNGTNVGTVISLQCPAKHRLVGGDLVCVLRANSTQWVGETYCKPLSAHEDFGFHVAVVASAISSAIILLMSMAFISCCVLDCLKEEEKKKKERDTDLWHRQERVVEQEERSSRYSHKGRNNNNNTTNAQEKNLSLWDNHDPVLGDEGKDRACRCHQHYCCGSTVPPSASTFGPAPPPVPLPGCGYGQPLLFQNSDLYQNTGPLQNSGSLQDPTPIPPQYQRLSLAQNCQAQNSGLLQNSTLGPSESLEWQYGADESSVSVVSRPILDDSHRMNVQSIKECSIRIISV